MKGNTIVSHKLKLHTQPVHTYLPARLTHIHSCVYMRPCTAFLLATGNPVMEEPACAQPSPIIAWSGEGSISALLPQLGLSIPCLHKYLCNYRHTTFEVCYA